MLEALALYAAWNTKPWSRPQELGAPAGLLLWVGRFVLFWQEDALNKGRMALWVVGRGVARTKVTLITATWMGLAGLPRCL